MCAMLILTPCVVILYSFILTTNDIFVSPIYICRCCCWIRVLFPLFCPVLHTFSSMFCADSCFFLYQSTHFSFRIFTVYKNSCWMTFSFFKGFRMVDIIPSALQQCLDKLSVLIQSCKLCTGVHWVFIVLHIEGNRTHLILFLHDELHE